MKKSGHVQQRWIRLAVAAFLSMLILACNLGQLFSAEKPSAAVPTLEAAPTQEPALPTAAPTAAPTLARPTETPELLASPTVKPTVKKVPTGLPTAVPDNTVSLFEGDFNGIKYTVIYPGNFEHTSVSGWEQFCLATISNLCTSIHPRTGNWEDSEAMANEVMGLVKRDVENLQIYHQQSTKAPDGFPAYWVGSTYTLKGVDYKSSNLFFVVQHIGFEIVISGEPDLVDSYQQILKSIAESFRLDYY